MLLARKIIENKCPDIYQKFEPHDSFYIGSDVFYAFIVENHFWDLRIRQRSREEYFSLAEKFAENLLTGKFSREMEEQFVKLLEYYGQDPIIVRSSSILEDGFGNAFAGKYESVFCSNSGDMDQRLEELENAVRTVYASTMSRSALDYRSRRGLQERDEQMALLVQRVSGSYYGEYYMPCVAGVGYSFSPYRFMDDLDPTAGMLRLVMGLSRYEKLDIIVTVDPVNYYNMPYKEKYKVGQAVGCVNWAMRGKNKKMLLMTPGRIGTSSPELGVPALFSDISEYEAICEIADSRAGYNPELSYGSHFFQDLVEAGILYNAIFENEKTIAFHPGLLTEYDNLLCDYDPNLEELKDIIQVYDVSDKDFRLCNDMKKERLLCFRAESR